MQSPKNSSKHSLVTYGSDISDEELDSLSNIPLPPRELSNDHSNEMRSMDISPITNDTKSNCSNEPSPKERIPQVIPLKRRKTNDSNYGGLVSYGMDEDEYIDDDDEEDYQEEHDGYYNDFNDDSENYLTFTAGGKEYPMKKADKSIVNIPESVQIVDNDECFNIEGRESDIDESNDQHDNDQQQRRPTATADIDLKSRSGQSSSQVKANVMTKRPKGSELPYLLSRQIFNISSNSNNNSQSIEIKLPPPPPGKPSPELEQRISDLRAKAKVSRCNITQLILNNKEYRNPSIYEKLIEHMKIDERGTNYPPELYDPYRFGEESYYEVLSKAQDAAERKRLEQLSSGSTVKPNKTTATKIIDSEMRMRKTKWDTGQSKTQMSKSHSNVSGVVIETKVMFPTHK